VLSYVFDTSVNAFVIVRFCSWFLNHFTYALDATSLTCWNNAQHYTTFHSLMQFPNSSWYRALLCPQKNPTRSWCYLVSSSSNFPCAPHWMGLMNMCHSQQPRQWKHPFGIRGKQNIGSVVGNKFAIHARRPQAEDKNLRFAIVKFPDAISTCHRSSTPFGHILLAIRGVITIRFSFALGQSRTQKHCGLLKPC
jgi:hypothetical protein